MGNRTSCMFARKELVSRELPRPTQKRTSTGQLSLNLVAMVHVFQSVELIRVIMVVSTHFGQVSIKSKGFFSPPWVKSKFQGIP